MKKQFFSIIILSASIHVYAIDSNSIKKYSNQLLTSDYGILNEANLKRYAANTLSEPFNWNITGFDYWQCFPTKDVKVWYEKGEYDPEEKAIKGDPHITIKLSPDVIYDYEPRRMFSIDDAKDKIKIWNRLLKKQQYVCIGGAYAGTYKKIDNGKKIIEKGWIFENLKTKKGCDSYFSGWCD